MSAPRPDSFRLRLRCLREVGRAGADDASRVWDRTAPVPRWPRGTFHGLHVRGSAR